MLHDGGHARLLQHDFRHPHAVRIMVHPPGEISPVAVVPAEQTLPKEPAPLAAIDRMSKVLGFIRAVHRRNPQCESVSAIECVSNGPIARKPYIVRWGRWGDSVPLPESVSSDLRTCTKAVYTIAATILQQLGLN